MNENVQPMLPETVDEARLPETYEGARKALAACDSIDECKDWADRSAALASYAKQAQDDALENMARKIRNRAIRRMGEVLQQVEPAPNHHGNSTRGGASPSSRRETARRAGLSRDQQKQAQRVASVPEREFEAMTEREKPATITELAKAGTKSLQQRSPVAQSAAGSKLLRAVASAHLSIAQWKDIWPEMTPAERRELREKASSIGAICVEIGIADG